MAEYLFTYGTLRLNQSHPMAELLASNARLIGLTVLPKAKLYRIDWYPALIETDDAADEVIGDLFELTDVSVLSKLDEYEGIGVGSEPFEYRRVKCTVRTEHGERESWVYFYNRPLPAGSEWIESGDFLNP